MNCFANICFEFLVNVISDFSLLTSFRVYRKTFGILDFPNCFYFSRVEIIYKDNCS